MKSIKLFTNSLKKSFTRPWILALSALLDLSFLFLVGFVMPFIRPFIDNHTVNVYQIISGRLQAAGAGTQAPSILSMLFQDPALPSTVGVIFWLLVAATMIYLIYSVFQGTAWWIALRKIGVSQKWKTYVAKFYWVNLLWFPMLAFLWILFAMVDVRAVTIESATQEPVSRVLHWIVGVIVLLVVYLMIVSYARLAVKTSKSFKQTFTDRQVLMTGLIVAVLFGLLQWLSVW